MATRIFHLSIDVADVLINWPEHDVRGMITDQEGHPFAAWECRRIFAEKLAKGHRKLPIGSHCEGFDYVSDGCPGHLLED